MRTLVVVICGLAATAARADVIHLTNGGTLEGVVLMESSDGVTVRMKYGTTRIPREEIANIEKTADAEPAQGPMARLADWQRCVAELARRPWGKDFRQIPATVIDTGVLAMVPYISHAAGDYEFNIYGDPDAPSCLEIGVREDLLKSDAAKKECVEFMAALLGDAKDQEFLRTLDLAKDKKVREGLTFEVTPETAEDAYGGWWISVYDEALVAKQRATEEEMQAIAMTREEMKKEEEAEKAAARAAAEARKKAEAAAKAANQPPPPVAYDPYAWKTGDLSRTRRRSKGGRYEGWIYRRGTHHSVGGYQNPYHAPNMGAGVGGHR